MPSRAFLSEEAEAEERADRDRLREIDGKIRLLRERRMSLIGRVRELSAEQKALYDVRQEPQSRVEALHAEHRELGRKFAAARAEREKARAALDAALARAREIRAEIPATERVNPERLRREIADLESRQQTHALSLDEENALIARLRDRIRLLRELEARGAILAQHEARRREAEEEVRKARARVAELTATLDRIRRDREERMEAIRSLLVSAGGVVAQIREKATARQEIMRTLDALGREIEALEREARQLLGAHRRRREEARANARAFGPAGRSDGRHGTPPPAVEEARLEELLKRGRITLG
ncbi:MAG: hypothetical protein QXG65_05545 [Thermoplasmata archaeon]